MPGLDAYPPETWPANIELLYYSFHVMAGLGTIFIALMALANLQRFRGRLETSTRLLWVLLPAFPVQFIANTAGWMTTELGRQPWLVYGLFRTSQGYSDVVSSGDVVFTLQERRELVAAIGPLWSWHEVWLVAAGGTFLLAFPHVFAAALAGFYLALWFVLWSFVMRGIAIEVGGHIDDRLWQSFWDFVFAAANVVLALLLGIAIGNVLRGVPIDAAGKFTMPLFTDFRPAGQVGLIDWYTAAVALFTATLLAAHGSTYLWLKTMGRLHERSERLTRGLWIATAILFPAVSLATWWVRPPLYEAMARRPVAWLAIALLVMGGWALLSGLRRNAETRAFAGSCAILVGLLAGAAASVFPVMLHSTIAPEFSMTAHSETTARHGLMIALFWWPIALVLALSYFVVVFRSYAGKATAG